jgi:cell division protein FtsW (lipid II flippase)/acetylornithine deacetylase/succinyl-diaminopimelate desuccinylase-like protein
MKLEEYLTTVTEQIRWRQAREMVENELKDHILDQKEAYEADGMPEEEALDRAVKEMGDPVDVGISMDRVHRPQMSAELLLLVGILSILSIAVHAALVGVESAYAISGETYLKRHILYILCGYVLMLVVYHLDYTILARRGRLLAGSCLVLMAYGLLTGTVVRGATRYLRIGFVQLPILLLFYLYFAFYVGVLYQYRGKGYGALVKIAVWTLLPIWMALRIPSMNLAITIGIVFLVTFTAAVWQNWYQIRRKTVLAAVWIAALAGPILGMGMISIAGNSYQLARIRAFLTSDPDYAYIGLTARKFLQSSYFLGKNAGNISSLADSLPGYNSDYIFVSLISAYGALAGVLVTALLLFLIVKIFRISLHQSNQLGVVLGTECGTVFLIQLLLCIGVNCNLLPASSVTLPFFSSGGSGILISYFLLGLVLSIYRYKNIRKKMHAAYENNAERRLKSVKRLLEHAGVQAALSYIRQDAERTFGEQLEMCEIPAPSFQEGTRADYVKNKFEKIGLEQVHVDEAGNVLGMICGTALGPTILLAAHLDTVFPIETDVTVRKEGGRYYCPGINDDTRALAEFFTIARSMKESGLRLQGDLIFCANVCEEGLGDLKGTKYLFQNGPHIDGFISIDDPETGAIIHEAVGSHRYEVIFSGHGGHSLDDFGLPNPIHAMGRTIQKIADFQVPKSPKTTFNVGVVQGGTSVNTISQSASMLVDLRSTSEAELKRLSKLLRQAIEQAVEEENARWTSDQPVKAKILQRGNRPAGSQDADAPIVRAAREAALLVGIEPVFVGAKSTDANVPISLGIPAITVGRGGKEGGVHTLQEWFEPEKEWLGPQRDLLLLLGLGGLDGCLDAELESSG